MTSCWSAGGPGESTSSEGEGFPSSWFTSWFCVSPAGPAHLVPITDLVRGLSGAGALMGDFESPHTGQPTVCTGVAAGSANGPAAFLTC